MTLILVRVFTGILCFTQTSTIPVNNTVGQPKETSHNKTELMSKLKMSMAKTHLTRLPIDETDKKLDNLHSTTEVNTPTDRRTLSDMYS